MFDAYTVAVKVALHDKVTSGLMGMSASFKKMGVDVDAFQSKLDKIKKTAFIGAGVAGAGLLGLTVFAKMAKPAEEYAHLLNTMNIQGLSHVQIAKAIGAAWKTTGEVVTSTVTGNLKNFIDLKNIFRGNVGEAIGYLPEFAKLAAVLGASSNINVSNNSHDLAFSVAKALDIRGAVSPKEFTKESEMMSKVIIATQGRVLPQDYQMAFKYARQATFGLSNQFLYTELPTLMMEMKTSGGGSGSHGGVGTSLAAGYRYVVQGIMTKAAHEALGDIGLAGGKYDSALKTTTTRTILKNGVKGAALFQYDPFQWTQDYLLPALHKKYGDNLSKQDLIRDINNLRMTQTASFAILQYALKSQQIYGDQKLIGKAKNMNDAYTMSLAHDPHTVMTALSAQWDNFKIAFMMGVVPVVLPTLMALTKGLNYLAQVLEHHKTLAAFMATGFFALFSAMALCGSVLLISAGGQGLITGFRILGVAMSGLLLNPVTLGILGLSVALGALYETVKHWSAVKNFIEHPIDSVHQGLEDLSVMGNPYLAKSAKYSPININLKVDGKTLAQIVTDHQGKAAAQQPSSGSGFNSSMNFASNMLNFGQ